MIDMPSILHTTLQYYQTLSEKLAHTALDHADLLLMEQLQQILQKPNGHFPHWLNTLAQLPVITNISATLNSASITVHSPSITPCQQSLINTLLKQLMPWRKGPYQFFSTFVDTEWRSDWKWRRLEAHISPLTNRIVLDVGCGNGYHCWRMAGNGAKITIGIDPSLLFLSQFWAMQHFIPDPNVFLFPFTLETMPDHLPYFDTVFSMGVLYHRRSPIDHLLRLRQYLRPGGELVLETLITQEHAVLVPSDRYAKMRNVWFLPSPNMLITWLKRCGFIHVRLVDISYTQADEQRHTNWMHYQSLPDFLDPTNKQRTIEGLPAPCRAIFIATIP